MTRQRKWQIEKQLAGGCVICGKKRDPDSNSHCKAHRKVTNVRVRNRYRVAHGISVHIKRDLRRSGGGK